MHVVQDVNLITKTGEFDKRGSADSGFHKVREINQKDAVVALGKPRGFGRRDVGAISLL